MIMPFAAAVLTIAGMTATIAIVGDQPGSSPAPSSIAAVAAERDTRRGTRSAAMPQRHRDIGAMDSGARRGTRGADAAGMSAAAAAVGHGVRRGSRGVETG
jgi:hypothetical protein